MDIRIERTVKQTANLRIEITDLEYWGHEDEEVIEGPNSEIVLKRTWSVDPQELVDNMTARGRVEWDDVDDMEGNGEVVILDITD